MDILERTYYKCMVIAMVVELSINAIVSGQGFCDFAHNKYLGKHLSSD